MLAANLEPGKVYIFGRESSQEQTDNGERSRILALHYAGPSGAKHLFDVVGLTGSLIAGGWSTGKMLLDDDLLEQLATR